MRCGSGEARWKTRMKVLEGDEIEKVCPECNGTGRFGRGDCPNCEGLGKVYVKPEPKDPTGSKPSGSKP
jgi:DnaJ-class molecular chaperone